MGATRAEGLKLDRDQLQSAPLRGAAKRVLPRTLMIDNLDLTQIFSPHIVAAVEAQPELLQPQTRELSILFADLCGFTALSRELSPQELYLLLGEILEALTDAVLDEDGVVLDYYGDGLSALWNAPLDCPDHADAACRAALTMVDSLPGIDARWRDRISGPLRVRVGVHTGQAHVGNAGTTRRFKYGPRGLAVHLASRVETAAKHLEVPVLITAATRRKLGNDFFTLRVCRAKLPGFAEPSELFAVYRAAQAARLQEKLDRYADALRLFEAGDLDATEQILEELQREPGVAPAEFLADHAASVRRGGRGRRATDVIGEGPDAVIEILAK